MAELAEVLRALLAVAALRVLDWFEQGE